MLTQSINVADGTTDGQTTCDRNTALCSKVHRAVKSMWVLHAWCVQWSVAVYTDRPLRDCWTWENQAAAATSCRRMTSDASYRQRCRWQRRRWDQQLYWRI